MFKGPNPAGGMSVVAIVADGLPSLIAVDQKSTTDSSPAGGADSVE